MSDFVKELYYNVDLDKTVEKTKLNTLFSTGDNMAHRFVLDVYAVEESKVIPKQKVVREKVFDLVPMTVDDAIEEIELLGHDFYVFLNKATGNVCVLYLRNDKDYGLIETRQ